MIISKKDKFYLVLLSILIAIIGYCIFWYSDNFAYFGDGLGSLSNINIITLLGQFVYYLLLLLGKLVNPRIIATLLYVVCSIIKYYGTRKILDPRTSFLMQFIFPITILFPLFGTSAYLGAFTPTVWHNLTTMLSVPFAILLFYYTIVYLKSSEIKALVLINIFAIVTNLMKPSYLFAFLPVYGILMLSRVPQNFKNKNFKIMILELLPGATSLLLILFNFLSNFSSDGNSIALEPFYLYMAWNNNSIIIFIYKLLLSLSLPIYVYRCSKQHSLETKLAWIVWFVGFAIACLFVESGDRRGHGNLTWQMIPCTYILIMYSMRDLKHIHHKYSKIFGSILFGLYVLSGFIYVISLFIGIIDTLR